MDHVLKGMLVLQREDYLLPQGDTPPIPIFALNNFQDYKSEEPKKS